MEIVQEKIDDLNAVLKVKVKPEDYKEQYDEGLKRYRKNISLPGFRPGHVPMGLIKKKYGPSILAEEINKMINEGLHNHIQENKLNILGNPVPKEGDKGGDWDNPTDFEFSYEIGVAPEFDLKKALKGKFPYYIIKVGEDMLEKEIENMRRRYGSLVPADQAKEKDMVLGQFVELDENGEPKKDGVMHTSTVSIEFLDDEKAKKSLIGIKVGDTLTVNPEDYSKGAADLAAMLGVKQEDLPYLSDKFNFTVTEIKRMQMAELNQELFDKLFGEGNVMSEKELREKISADLSKMFLNDSDRMFKRDVSEQLVENVGMPLPDAFLKRWIKLSNETELTDEQIDSEYDMYSNSLRWQLIENKIIKENDIKVESQEVIEYTKGLIVSNYAQYGMPAPPDEELTKNAQSVLQNQDEARKIYQQVYDEKVMDHLKGTLTLKEKEVTYDEFVKLASKEN